MPTTKSTSERKQRWQRLAVPAVGIAGGVAYLIALWMGGQPGEGVAAFVFMAVVTLAIVIASRWSETIRGLMDQRDERISRIDLRATAFAGTTVVVAVLACFVVELARGQDGQPFAALGAIGGVSYIAAVVALRLRG